MLLFWSCLRSPWQLLLSRATLAARPVRPLAQVVASRVSKRALTLARSLARWLTCTVRRSESVVRARARAAVRTQARYVSAASLPASLAAARCAVPSCARLRERTALGAGLAAIAHGAESAPRRRRQRRRCDESAHASDPVSRSRRYRAQSAPRELRDTISTAMTRPVTRCLGGGGAGGRSGVLRRSCVWRNGRPVSHPT